MTLHYNYKKITIQHKKVLIKITIYYIVINLVKRNMVFSNSTIIITKIS